MDITLKRVPFRPTRTRGLGAALGLALGALVALPVLLTDDMDLISRGTATAAIPIGAILGWLFAHAAAIPGWRSALLSATGFALVAVSIGSFAVAAGASIYAGSTPDAAATSTIMFGILGLIFLGLPMFALTLPVALIWVGALRLALRARHSIRAPT